MSGSLSGTFVKSLWEYLKQCPAMVGGKMQTNRGEIELEISPDVTESTATRYVRGTALQEYVFTLQTAMEYPAESLKLFAELDFYGSVASWLYAQKRVGFLPQLPGGMAAKHLEVLEASCLFTDGLAEGNYRMRLKLHYIKQGEI